MFFQELSSESHRIFHYHDTSGDTPHKIQNHILGKPIYLIYSRVILHNQVWIISKLLWTKFVIRIHLLLILFSKIHKSLKLLSRKKMTNNFHRNHTFALVLRTLHKICISSQTFFQVTLHTIQTKGMTTFLFHKFVYRSKKTSNEHMNYSRAWANVVHSSLAPCRVVNSKCWRWHEPWCRSRVCCCWTNRRWA